MLTAFACEQSISEGDKMSLDSVHFFSLVLNLSYVLNVFVVLYNKSLNDWSLGKPVNFVS